MDWATDAAVRATRPPLVGKTPRNAAARGEHTQDVKYFCRFAARSTANGRVAGECSTGDLSIQRSANSQERPEKKPPFTFEFVQCHQIPGRLTLGSDTRQVASTVHFRRPRFDSRIPPRPFVVGVQIERTPLPELDCHAIEYPTFSSYTRAPCSLCPRALPNVSCSTDSRSGPSG
jgi:hypothetical protein